MSRLHRVNARPEYHWTVLLFVSRIGFALIPSRLRGGPFYFGGGVVLSVPTVIRLRGRQPHTGSYTVTPQKLKCSDQLDGLLLQCGIRWRLGSIGTLSI